MRIRYTIPLKRKIIIDDHWQIPFQGGKLRIIEESGYARALEIVFTEQPLEYAPHVENHSSGELAMSITDRDHRIIFVKHQLINAASFLKCMFDIELIIDEIAVAYEGETADEESQIVIKGFTTGRHEPALPLPFDIITRSIMAAEDRDGPMFEATLADSARKALFNQKYIDSFRYSFLMIETLFGKGQFRKAGLKEALKSNREFVELVEMAIRNLIPTKDDQCSDTANFLSGNPMPGEVIDHLVEKRGLYFHGNSRRKDAWKPDKQGGAESLALLAISIVHQITAKAAQPVFAPNLASRHFQNAKQVGATIVFEIVFKFRRPEEVFVRERTVNVTMPGTKVTSRSSFMLAQQFFQDFQRNEPPSELLEAKCSVKETGEKIFTVTFHTAERVRKNE